MRSSRALPFLVLLALTAAVPARAADPFYTNLLREGTLAYDQGRYAEASRDLGIACFGLLEEPPILAECLVRLGLAQDAADDAGGFQDTFRRLLEAEDLLGAYRRADLSPALREEFERALVRRIPASTLLASPSFGPVTGRYQEEGLGGSSPESRQAELRQQIEADPDDPEGPLMLARFELDQGDPEAAVEALNELLDRSPENLEGRCYRGRALSELGRCRDALGDLEACGPLVHARPRLTAALLECRVELRQWAEARALVDRLPAEWRQKPGLAPAVSEVEQNAPPASVPTPSPAPAKEEETVVPPDEKEPAPEVPVTVGKEPATVDREQIEEVRSASQRAASRNEMLEALDAARALAERFPDDREVQHTAAEIAYRASKWEEAVGFFRRGGDPGDDHPELLFYLAVSLYQTGRAEEAARTLERCVARLRPTDFVRSYVKRILGPAGPS